jgi:hypothetical protein
VANTRCKRLAQGGGHVLRGHGNVRLFPGSRKKRKRVEANHKHHGHYDVK